LTQQLYVPIDANGAQWWDSTHRRWPLPEAAPGESVEGDLILYTASGLLGRLDERIYKAEAAGEPPATSDHEGEVTAASAKLMAATSWDGFCAARFALDCAAHVAGEAAGAALPDGTTLAEVLDRARAWLDQADESESGLGSRLRQLAICRRLRRSGKDLGDLAFSKVAADIGADLDMLDDPEWTSIASARDAILAAVEAVQHAVMPQVTEIQSRRYEHFVREGDAATAKTLTATRAHQAWVPYWTAADDSAERARQAAADSGGADGAASELAWQADLLAGALG
jgi:hypothetical protein